MKNTKSKFAYFHILILLSGLFSHISPGVCFQNEPDGFRGISWGEDLSKRKDMLFRGKAAHAEAESPYLNFERRDDKKNMEAALLERIEYHADTQNRFFEVEIYFAKGKENNAALTAVLEDHFGKPDSSQVVDENLELLFWSGQKAEVKVSKSTFSRSRATIKKKKSGPERSSSEDTKYKLDQKIKGGTKNDF